MFGQLKAKIATFSQLHVKIAEYLAGLVKSAVFVKAVGYVLSSTHQVSALSPLVIGLVTLTMPLVFMLINDLLNWMGLGPFVGMIDQGITVVVQQGTSTLQQQVSKDQPGAVVMPIIPPTLPPTK